MWKVTKLPVEHDGDRIDDSWTVDSRLQGGKLAGSANFHNKTQEEMESLDIAGMHIDNTAT